VDGPLGRKKYLDKYPNGSRYENVLQYAASMHDIEHAGSVHARVDLTDGDIEELRKVDAHNSMTIDVKVNVARLQPQKVFIRLKLLYARERDLRSVLEATKPYPCSNVLATLLEETAKGTEKVEIGARIVRPGIKALSDGCHDRISARFN